MRESSLLAHEGVKLKKESHYKEILRALKKIETGTSRFISNHTSLTYHQVARRLKELETNQKVKAIGRDLNQPYKPVIWGLV